MNAVFMCVQIAVMIGVPIVLCIVLVRRYRLPLRVFMVGMAAFVASQIVHIPMNFGIDWVLKRPGMPEPPREWALVVTAVILGFTAGLCEEWARYIAIRRFLPKARSWGDGVMFGAGHGGVESMILGVLVALGVLNALVFQWLGPEAMGIPPDQVEVVREGLAPILDAPWYVRLLAAAERLMAMTLHIAASTLVMLAVVRGQASIVWLAVGWHWLVDAVIVYAAGTWGAVASELVLLGLTLPSIGILLATRRAMTTQ